MKIKSNITSSSLVLISALFGVSQSNAQDILFDAAKDCTVFINGDEINYEPPCHFKNNQKIKPDYIELFNESNILKKISYKTAFQYQFDCDAKKPLWFDYALEANGKQKGTSVIQATGKQSTQLVSINHDYGKAKFTLQSINGLKGFQIIKHCQLTMDALVSYPDPVALQPWLELYKQQAFQLKTMMLLATPSTGYQTVIDSIDNGIDFLKFKQDTVKSGLIKQHIKLTIADLTQAEKELSHQCSVNAETKLCTQALASTRSYIQKLVADNAKEVNAMKSALNEQIQWLQTYGYEFDGDVKKLQKLYKTAF